MLRHRVVRSCVLLAGTTGALALTVSARPEAAEQAAPTAFRIRLEFVKSTPTQAKKHPQPEALLDAGGQVIAAPLLLTQDNMPAEFKSEQKIPYLIENRKMEVGWTHADFRARAVPHLLTNGAVQLDLDIDYEDVVQATATSCNIAKFGLFNSRRLKMGQETAFGTWTQYGKLVTVFVRVDAVKSQKN